MTCLPALPRHGGLWSSMRGAKTKSVQARVLPGLSSGSLYACVRCSNAVVKAERNLPLQSQGKACIVVHRTWSSMCRSTWSNDSHAAARLGGLPRGRVAAEA
eukprot:11299256-Heterocapsa_arctica.AAC.1